MKKLWCGMDLGKSQNAIVQMETYIDRHTHNGNDHNVFVSERKLIQKGERYREREGKKGSTN